MNYEHNGKQSHATRLEMLIALNYLIENCPNEEKTSKTIELQKYAEENFNGVLVDRRRANEIFDDLVEFTSKYPSILPYKVMKVNKKPRYYVKKTYLNNKDIERIASAIKNHGALTEKASNQLIERFLDKVCDEEKKNQVIKIIHKTPSLLKHSISDEQMNKIEQFEWLRDNQARFYFKLLKRPNLEDVTSPYPLRNPTNPRPIKKVKEIYNGYFPGYVFEVSQTSKSTKVCIYLPDHKSAVITNINNVALYEFYDPIESVSKVSYELYPSKVKIDDWFISYFKGKAGHFGQRKIQFKFYVGQNEEHLIDYKSKFEEFFKEPMVYTLKEREVEITSLSGEKRKITAVDAYVEVECCFDAFQKWYWESRAFESVVVLNPSNWNDRLLDTILHRFAKRLTNYGERYNYELKESIKPEYEKMMKERHERFLKLIEEKNQRETSLNK